MQPALVSLFGGLILACASTVTPPVAAPVAPEAAAASTAPAPTALVVDREVVFEGMCDASGAVELDAGTFMVADDEDNLLRVYDAIRGGPPLAAIDVSRGVGLQPRGTKRPRMPELDLEAATRIGDRAYWLTSHGRNSRGRLRPERMRFFATTLPGRGAAAAQLEVVGSSDRLLDALIADPRFAPLGLAVAAERAPKADGGLNLEGMTAGPDGRLLLGFRNPVPDGLALLFFVDAPDRLLADDGAISGAIAPPIRVDLGGLGVRGLTWWRDRYVIVAGHHASGGPFRLYTWDGVGAPTAIAVELTGYNPEATFSPDGVAELMLLSDDGEVAIDGQPCKEVTDHGRRRFRGVWLRPTTVGAGGR